jgi:hypothetical protein
MSVAEPTEYRSPISKLLRFFRRSRDQWKAKCQAAKKENKSLKIRLAKMKESRDRWRAKAKAQSGNQDDAEAVTLLPDAESKNRLA